MDGRWQVFERLRARNFALCIADGEGYLDSRQELTADYAMSTSTSCAMRVIRRRTWRAGPKSSARRPPTAGDVFVYFKHEEAGTGPEFARMLLAALADQPT